MRFKQAEEYWDSFTIGLGYTPDMADYALPIADPTIHTPPRPRRWIPVSFNLLIGILGAPSLSAQDSGGNAVVADAEFPFEIPSQQAVSAAHGEQRVLRFEIVPGMFDDLVFGSESTAGLARDNAQRDLRQRIEKIGQVCQLTDAQMHKLQLAGRGDIKRFFDRADQMRNRFNIPYAIDGDRHKVANWVAELAQDVLPLQRLLHEGLFNDDSLFTKTLRGIATAEQFDRIVARSRSLRARREFVPQPGGIRVAIKSRRVELEQAVPAAVPDSQD